jgi:hypothetical protein
MCVVVPERLQMADNTRCAFPYSVELDFLLTFDSIFLLVARDPRSRPLRTRRDKPRNPAPQNRPPSEVTTEKPMGVVVANYCNCCRQQNMANIVWCYAGQNVGLRAHRAGTVVIIGGKKGELPSSATMHTSEVM